MYLQEKVGQKGVRAIWETVDMFFEVRTQSMVKKNFQSITVLLFWYSEQNNKVTNLGFQNEDEKVPSTTPWAFHYHF